MASRGEFIPTLNTYIQSKLLKGEGGSYADSVNALGAVKNVTDLQKDPNIERLLTRLLQFGSITISTVKPLLESLKTQDPSTVRLLYYLVQLTLGDGSAGTPLPVPAAKAYTMQPRAVDRYGPEVLSASWADLSEDKSAFMRKQGALRALSALAHASLTSKPDDPTYVGGLFVTLQSLLDRLESIRANRKGLASLIAQHGSTKKKNMVQDFKSRMEVWGLMRMAFSAARVALSKSGINKIALRSFPGVCSNDPVGARHALALACLVARDPQGAGTFIQEVGPLLKNNVELARRTGSLVPGAQAAAKGAAANGAPPPTVNREQAEDTLNLRDPWARIYLARACAAVIQSPHVAGDLHGSGEYFWEALQFMALADSNDMVAMEAIRAMFGAPYPKPDSIKRRPGANSGQGPEHDADVVQGRIYGASWQMNMSVADKATAVPEYAWIAHPPKGGEQATSPESSLARPMSSVGGADASGSKLLFACITARLLKVLDSPSRGKLAAACKTLGVMAEARAWCMSLSGHVVDTEGVSKLLPQLQSVLTAVYSDVVLGANERSAAAVALVWLLDTQANAQVITPATLVKVAAQGGYTMNHVVKALFADPWPEALASSFLTALQHRMRSAPAMADTMLDLALALCAATPSRVVKDQLQQLMDAAPGPSGVRAAMALLSSPLPPIAQPTTHSAVEVKAMACQEEVAFDSLRCFAAWWLSEHVNQVAGVCAWKPAGKKPVLLPLAPGVPAPADPAERMAAAAVIHSPMLAMTISLLQRVLLTGSWELRCAVAQALSKVAVRSREPYRIQCYTALAATQELLPVGGDGRASTAMPDADALGMAAVVRPALEVLDAMYAGEIVVNSQLSVHGLAASSWPKPALQSLQRRHEWLLFMIQQRIGFVPKDVFFPLGRASRRLLRPDEPKDEEDEEEEEEQRLQHVPKGLPKDLVEAATAAAAAALAAEQAQQQEQVPHDQQYDQQQYDQQYYDQQYYDEQYYDEQYYNEQYYNEQYYDQEGAAEGQYTYTRPAYADGQADPLARWQEGSAGSTIAANVAFKVAVEDADTEAASTAQDETYQDEELYRWGSVLYTFTADNSDEVSVQANERIKVLADYGDWLYVLSSNGSRGMVPSSYVSVEEAVAGGYESTSVAQSAQSPRAQQYYYDQQQQPAVAAAAPSYSNSEAAPAYRSQGYGGQGYDAFGDGTDGSGYGSYFNRRNNYEEDDDDSGGISKKKGGGGLDDFGAALATVAAAPRPAQPAQPPAPQAQPPVSLPTASSFEDNAFGDDAFGGSAFGAQAAPSGVSTFETQPSVSQAPVEAAAPAQAAADVGATDEAGQPATALYDFTAEGEQELSIRAGEQLVLGPEQDGWHWATRLSDGASGLVPGSYLQLN